ncbi:glycoprotein X [Sarocladium implicatum]|nr:glycoprotein X [Sarocladium implicatum]
MRHSTTLWAAVSVLSLVAADEEFGAIVDESVPQLDENGFDKRQCCCYGYTSTITETATVTVSGYPVIPTPETLTVYEPTTVYTTIEDIITEWETQIQTQIRTTSYPYTVEVPINCVPADETSPPSYPTGPVPEECSTITTTEWRTTTELEFVTSYRPTTVPTTIEVEVPVPTTIRNTVTNENTVTRDNTVTRVNTVTDENTVTRVNTITNENTVTDLITTTAPGRTVTRTITTTAPAQTTTITEEGTTVTRTLPGSTVVVTTTEVLPGETLVITPIFDVTLCPRPTGNGEPVNYASDETWGCKPGFVCNPVKPDGCNFWSDLPTDDFRCKPEECIVAPPYANVTWEKDETTYYPPSYGYFYLNPEAFGLSYGIYEFDIIVEKDKHTTRTITTGDWTSQASLTEYPRPATTSTTQGYEDSYQLQEKREEMHWYKKRAPVAPGVCLDECNEAALQMQVTGKVPRICEEDSSFQNAYASCTQCISANGNSTRNTIREYVQPTFGQIFNWCDEQDASTTTPVDTEGPESQVETVTISVTTADQISAVEPTFEPITETEGTTTTTSTSVEETTVVTSTPVEETTSSAEEPSEEPTPVSTPEDIEEVTSTVAAATVSSSALESSSSSAPESTPEDVVSTPEPLPTSTPEEQPPVPPAGTPEVIPPPDQPTGEAETPTGPEVVEPTAAASSLSRSMFFVAVASIFALFFA